MPPVDRIALGGRMTAAATRAVVEALTRGGHAARFVGGAVRDAVLGRPIRDIDIATDATPDRVVQLLGAAGIRVVPTGLSHGTVTAVTTEGKLEVTTLRRDVETFGRRARVIFTDDWHADAARRDFTMNALSCTLDGEIYDDFGGLEDARDGRVRFVGDARMRIREDFLRGLRFFRFQAHYGGQPPDPEALAACRELAPLLQGLSGERVRAELLRLLAAPDPAPIWRLMVDEGVVAVLVPAAVGTDRLAALVAVEAGCGRAADPLLRLAALVGDDRAGADAVADRLRLSNDERGRLATLAAPPVEVDLAAGPPSWRRALYRMGAPAFIGRALLRAAGAADPATGVGGALAAALRSALAEAEGWRPPVLPLAGADVVARGVPPGPRVGTLLAAVEAWWEAEDFRPDRAACLAELDRLIAGAG